MANQGWGVGLVVRGMMGRHDGIGGFSLRGYLSCLWGVGWEGNGCELLVDSCCMKEILDYVYFTDVGRSGSSHP